MITIYAIPNCNTVKKALQFLKEKGIDYQFHDYKKQGISTEKLSEWCDKLGWEKVLNKNGLTWKKQSEEVKVSVQNSASAITFMQANTSAIKRPLIEYNKNIILGFDEAEYSNTF